MRNILNLMEVMREIRENGGYKTMTVENCSKTVYTTVPVNIRNKNI